MNQILDILLVDTDPMRCAIAEIALSLDRAICVTRASGAQALAIATDPASRFEAVLLDERAVDRPAGQLIAALCRRTPVIVLAARFDTRTLDAYADAGARAVLPAPFDPLVLARDVRLCLAERMPCHRWWARRHGMVG